MTSASIGHISGCQICSASPLDTVLSLGFQPLPSAYLSKAQLEQPEIAYPLTLCRCASCGLLQLDYIADPTLVFPSEYPYHTGLTNMLVRNFQSLADTVIPAYTLAPGSLVVDIGSNDGTLLRPFKEQGMRVLGIEPTDVANMANANGIETIQEYLSVVSARAAVATHGRAKVVTATNVFAHIPNPTAVVESIKELLEDDGVFISESQYLLDIVEKLEFDTIYHEHLRFYALRPLQALFHLTGMSIVDAERISAAGGSIRVYAMKGDRPASPRVADMLSVEEAAGLYDAKALQQFGERATHVKRDLMALLLDCGTRGRIVGIGSPVRANTLLGFVHVDAGMLEYICEKEGSPKIGLFTPGTHIPIVDERRLLEDQPEYALVNSWHIGAELMKKSRELGYRGTFIMPLPELRLFPLE